MKKSILFVAAFVSVAMVNATVITTNVYDNSFVTSAETTMEGAVMGTPAVTFSTKQIATAGDAAKVPATNANYLQIQNKKASGGVTGQNMVMASVDSFAAPFTAKLSEIKADSIIWTFNFRNNNQYKSKGFDSGYNGYANVLVADTSDLQEGNGYAVVMGGLVGSDGEKCIKLVRYTNGLDANANITKILSSADLTLKKYWSVRVTYLPATNTWKLAVYEDQSAFIAPEDVTAWTECGSAVDATYTSNKMTTFGFYNNYSGNIDGIMYVKNYKITAYTNDDPSGLNTAKTTAIVTKKMVNGKLVIVKDGVQYNALGVAL